MHILIKKLHKEGNWLFVTRLVKLTIVLYVWMNGGKFFFLLCFLFLGSSVCMSKEDDDFFKYTIIRKFWSSLKTPYLRPSVLIKFTQQSQAVDWSLLSGSCIV